VLEKYSYNSPNNKKNKNKNSKVGQGKAGQLMVICHHAKDCKIQQSLRTALGGNVITR